MKKHIPYYLILLRLAFVPIILVFGYKYGEQVNILVLSLMTIGLVSDIFDGIIARNLGLQTALIRRLDSQVDMLFWLSIGIYTYWTHPEIILNHIHSVRSILIMEVLCYLLAFKKFGKESAFHPLLSKTWGLCLLAAFVSIIGFGYGGIAFKLAVFFGIVSHIDRILITILLPRWVHDVPSFYHAYLIRKGKTINLNSILKTPINRK